MAATVGTTIQGKSTYVQITTFQTAALANTVLSPATTTTILLGSLVPADGAELIDATFTITTAGGVTTSGTQQWSCSDGTNALFTMAATSSAVADSAAGTVRQMTMGSATNGKNIATTAGSRLTLTNTVAGTITAAIAGIFKLVWAL